MAENQHCGHGVIKEAGGHGGDIPAIRFHVASVPFHFLHALDFHVKANLGELALDQRRNVANGAVIGRHSEDKVQRLTIFLTDTSFPVQRPAGGIQQLDGAGGVIAVGFGAFDVRIWRAFRNNGVGHRLVAIGQAFADGFLIDGASQRLAHAEIRQVAVEVENDVAHRRASRSKFSFDAVYGECLLVVLVTQLRRAVDQIDLAGFQRLQAGGVIGNVFRNNLIITRTSPQ